jgi:hypothetical protein
MAVFLEAAVFGKALRDEVSERNILRELSGK